MIKFKLTTHAKNAILEGNSPLRVSIGDDGLAWMGFDEILVLPEADGALTVAFVWLGREFCTVTKPARSGDMLRLTGIDGHIGVRLSKA